MDVTLPANLTVRVEQELSRGLQRLEALRRIGESVDQAGLYQRVLIPGEEDDRCKTAT